MLRCLSVRQPPQGKVRQRGQVWDVLQRHIQNRVQQSKGRLRVGDFLLTVMEEQLGKSRGICGSAVFQQSICHGLGLIADHADLPGGQVVIRVDQAIQIFRPQLKGTLLLGTGFYIGGKFLLIAGEKTRQDVPHQVGGLAADITIRLQ